ncbi:MAG TPA: S1/P1 nuclease, partial [Rhizomicrobium sp.]
ADNHDRGGNDIHVMVGRYRTSMHHLWDGDLVTALGDDPARVAIDIDSRFSRTQKRIWQSGTPADWAFESFLVAEHDIYAPLQGRDYVVLPRDYAWREAPIVRAQLEKAGLRLAWVLDQIFK